MSVRGLDSRLPTTAWHNQYQQHIYGSDSSHDVNTLQFYMRQIERSYTD